MQRSLTLILLLVAFTGVLNAQSSSERRNQKKEQQFVPVVSNEFPSDFPYNVNFLEPQFQYPQVGGFNYVPSKQPQFPRSQPPLILLAGAAPPGQQFLLQQPGAPPGNFLIPQPEGPNVILRGSPNPQYPVYIPGYPKGAQVPPIEKDAEEVPNLAGNHPVVGDPSFTARKPEKIETLDEPQAPTEADDLAPADKNSSPFPKKFPAPQPRLKPGQRFFILNGRPLYSNFPIEPQLQLPQQYQPDLNQQQDVFYIRPQPQFFSAPQPQDQGYQVPIQGVFLRSPVANVPLSAAADYDRGNFIALNQPDDFKQQGFLVRNAIPSTLEVVPSKISKSDAARLGKTVQFVEQPALLPAGQFLSGYGDGYYFADLRNSKEDDDTVVIDAKAQDEVESETTKPPPKKEEIEGTLSQAQPAAVAIAGLGGVASTAPRGTALAGPKGLAISSPQATSVAGPREEDENEKKPKPKKEKH